MSKSRKRRAQQRNAMPSVLPGFVRGNVTELRDAINAAESGRDEFPDHIKQALLAFAVDAGKSALVVPRPLCDLEGDRRLEFFGMLLYAASMGFGMALYRYADELKHVPELSAWQKTRRQAGDKGRASQTRSRLNRMQQAQAMLDQGMDVPKIAQEMGCSIATVYRALKPGAIGRRTPAPRSSKR